VRRNTEIFRSIVPQVAAAAPGSILLVVANPVDVLTYAAWKFSGFPAGRVIGSGTVLDTGRLRALIGQQLAVDPRSVHAYVIGEHGDSEVVVWSRASVAGMPLGEFCSQRGTSCEDEMQEQIAHQVRRAAYEIIERKGATYYAIGLGIRHIIESILGDQNTVLTVSTLLDGQFGVSDICLSLPSIVDHSGVEVVLAPALSDDELAAFRESARVVTETAPMGCEAEVSRGRRSRYDAGGDPAGEPAAVRGWRHGRQIRRSGCWATYSDGRPEAD
jgi:L-lactate dehydrogenase